MGRGADAKRNRRRHQRAQDRGRPRTSLALPLTRNDQPAHISNMRVRRHSGAFAQPCSTVGVRRAAALSATPAHHPLQCPEPVAAHERPMDVTASRPTRSSSRTHAHTCENGLERASSLDVETPPWVIDGGLGHARDLGDRQCYAATVRHVSLPHRQRSVTSRSTGPPPRLARRRGTPIRGRHSCSQVRTASPSGRRIARLRRRSGMKLL